jgi:RimJ/RimL family protein N-acetyltransferase
MIELKKIREQDKASMIEIFKDFEVKQTYMLPDYENDEGYEKLFNGFLKLSESPLHYVRGIYLNDNLIGFINDVEKTEESIELGYVVSPKYKGNGYCTEALEKSINYLLSRFYKEIICGAFETNKASIRVMEKAGMKKINKIDEIEYRGKKHICVYYSYHI